MSGFPLFSYINDGDYVGAFAYIAGCLAIIFLILPFHEYAHGWAANKLGDPTARYTGRLSLNPMRHIDWMGAILIMVAGFGWAKPVPVNTRYFKRPKWDMAITALAGPVSNLLFALVALVLANVVRVLAPADQIMFMYQFFTQIALINIGLAVFNLIPIPPLDGSRLLTALLPNDIYYKIMQYEQYIMMGLFVLIFAGVLDGPLSYLRYYAMNGVQWLADLPFGF